MSLLTCPRVVSESLTVRGDALASPQTLAGHLDRDRAGLRRRRVGCGGRVAGIGGAQAGAVLRPARRSVRDQLGDSALRYDDHRLAVPVAQARHDGSARPDRASWPAGCPWSPGAARPRHGVSGALRRADDDPLIAALRDQGLLVSAPRANRDYSDDNRYDDPHEHDEPSDVACGDVAGGVTERLSAEAGTVEV